MNTLVEPNARNQPYFPNRYGYFRDGALYVMGGTVMDKDDPVLKSFNKQGKKKEKAATAKAPYVAFQDYGAPVKKTGAWTKPLSRPLDLKLLTAII